LYAGAAAAEHAESKLLIDFLRLGKPPLSVVPLAGPEAGDAWFDLEWQNVLATARLAADLDRHNHAWRLPRVIWKWLWQRGYNVELVDIHERALNAAQNAGDPLGEATARNYLASGYFRLGRWHAALAHLHSALELWYASGDEIRKSSTLSNIATV